MASAHPSQKEQVELHVSKPRWFEPLRSALQPLRSPVQALPRQRQAANLLLRLQDSTHYERTQAILRKYDPEYAKAQAKEREAARREGGQADRPPSTPNPLPVCTPAACQRLSPGSMTAA